MFLLHFMAEELFVNHDHQLDLNLLLDDRPELNTEPNDLEIAAESVSEEDFENEKNLFEKIHARFAPSRRLYTSFFYEETAVRSLKARIYFFNWNHSYLELSRNVTSRHICLLLVT